VHPLQAPALKNAHFTGRGMAGSNEFLLRDVVSWMNADCFHADARSRQNAVESVVYFDLQKIPARST